VRTRLLTAAGWLDFQDYFVRQRCAPAVREVAFAGADEARPQPEFLTALADENLRAVVICPSNPFISVDPILAVSGVRECGSPAERRHIELQLAAGAGAPAFQGRPSGGFCLGLVEGHGLWHVGLQPGK
jgi:hypothetical protein